MKTANRWTNVVGIFFALMFTGCNTMRSAKSGLESSKAFERKFNAKRTRLRLNRSLRRRAENWWAARMYILYTTERVFYSSKRNSCICMLRAFYVVKGKGFYDILTIDALTKEDLGSRSYSGDEGNNIAKDVEDKVKSLE